jgi:hypothetical protein
MSTLPSTGPLSVSAVRTLFGSSFKQLSLHRGIAAGVPTTGAISISQLRGKAPSVPSVSAISTRNVNTGSTAQSGSLNLASFVTDTYGGTLSYSAPSFTAAHFTTCSVSGTTLSYSHPLNKFASSSATVTVTNRFGKTATITVPFLVVGYAIEAYTPSSLSLTNNTATYTMSSYFADYSGAGLTYTVTSNPYSNASVTSGVLSIVGNNRNTSYSVTVQASNSFGQTASISVSVTEALPLIQAPSVNISSVSSLFSDDVSAVSGSGGCTLSFWIKLNSTPSSNSFIFATKQYINAGTILPALRVFVDTSRTLYVSLFEDSTGTALGNISSSSSFNVGSWYHVLVTASPTNSVKAYVNGTQVASATFAGYTLAVSSLNRTMKNFTINAHTDIAGRGLLASYGQFFYDDRYSDSVTPSNFYASGNAVNIGSNGAAVFGTAPRVYMKFTSSPYHTNSGTLQNFNSSSANMQSNDPNSFMIQA